MSKSILTAAVAAIFSVVAFENLQAEPRPPSPNPRHHTLNDSDAAAESNAAGEKEAGSTFDKQESGKF